MSDKIMTVRQLIDALQKQCYGGEFVDVSASDQETGGHVSCALIYEIDYDEPSNVVTLRATNSPR